MPPADPWLKRQNAALRLLGRGVSLDVAGSKIRLRATMPPKPDAPAGSVARQQRISTGLSYPGQASEAVALAEALGLALERDRVGVEPFDWEPWLNRTVSPETGTTEISGEEAMERTRDWWFGQGVRSTASGETWRTCYELYLKRLTGIPSLAPSHLETLVKSFKPGSRSRAGCGVAVTALIRALGWPEAHIETIKSLAKGYTAASVAPRRIPTDAQIEAIVDALPDGWQWVVGLMATYGCRPHEALLHAEVQPSGLLRVASGKTGARQSLPLPSAWVERWRLHDKRMPAIRLDRPSAGITNTLTAMFRYRNLPCRPYDLRHAWAVRAIRNPKISPSLAAKSMGHTLSMHSKVYQRWFDSSEMEAVHAALIAAS